MGKLVLGILLMSLFFVVPQLVSGSPIDGGLSYYAWISGQVGAYYFDNVNLKYAAPHRDSSFDKSYKLAVFDDEDKEIFSREIFIPYEGSNSRLSECFYELNNTSIYNLSCDSLPSYFEVNEPQLFSLPYSNRGVSLKLFNSEGFLLDSYDVSNFADYCGDGVCSALENNLVCQADCGSFYLDEGADRSLSLNLVDLDVEVNKKTMVSYNEACGTQSENCLKINNQDNELGVYVKKDSELVLNYRGGDYSVSVEELDEGSEVILKSVSDGSESILFLSNSGYPKLKGDWSKFPEIFVKYESSGCYFHFNPLSTSPMNEVCD